MALDYYTNEQKIKKYNQHLLYKIYLGKLGEFFDNYDKYSQYRGLEEQELEPLKRLRSLLKRKKGKWNDAIPMFTNYFKTIANAYSSFVVGDGVRFRFQEENEATKLFRDWWQYHEMDNVISNNVKMAIITGFDGLRLVKHDDEVYPSSIEYNNFYPKVHPIHGVSKEEGHLVWRLQKDKENFLYTVDIVKERGFFRVKHSLHLVKIGIFGQVGRFLDNNRFIEGKVNDRLEEIVGVSGVDSDGYELQSYSYPPFSMFHTDDLDENGMGQSLAEPCLPHIMQDAFIDSMFGIEMREHMLSKMAIPSSMLKRAKDGTFAMGNSEYIPFDDRGNLPAFITKDQGLLPLALEFKRKLKENISTITGLPFEILSSDGKSFQERTELAKIRKKPFEKRVSVYQNKLDKHFMNIYKSFFTILNITPPQVELEHQPLFEVDPNENALRHLQEFQTGAIGQKHYLRITNREYTEDQIDDIVEDSNENPYNGNTTSQTSFKENEVDQNELNNK